VALAIVLIVTSIIIFSFSNLNSRKSLETSVLLASSILEEARSLTISSVDSSQYGVYLEDSQVTLFKGSTYSALSSDNVITSLNPKIGIRNINLSGGGSSVVFQRLTGGTQNFGTFELFVIADPDVSTMINITATGVVQ